VGDHFGWHPSTGPDVAEREGHIFAGNLLVADETFREPLLRVEQARGLCGTLTNPPLTRLDDNVYVRTGDPGGRSLLAWSPVAGANCATEFNSLDGLTKLHPKFEAHGLYLNEYYGSVFKSTELKNYQPATSFKRPGVAPLPAEIQKLLGWPKQDSYAPGAYPAK
jgi:hypothetical protein